MHQAGAPRSNQGDYHTSREEAYRVCPYEKGDRKDRKDHPLDSRSGGALLGNMGLECTGTEDSASLGVRTSSFNGGKGVLAQREAPDFSWEALTCSLGVRQNRKGDEEGRTHAGDSPYGEACMAYRKGQKAPMVAH